MEMTLKEIHEGLVTLYLRLNGYFTAGFIVHSAIPNRVITELDLLAVRFQHASEREREVGLATELRVPSSATDLLLCEVKSGTSNAPQFNAPLRSDPYAMAAVLRRFGAFPDAAVPEIARELQTQLDPSRLAGTADFPSVCRDGVQARAILFAVSRTSRRTNQVPFIHGQHLLAYIWSCLRPAVPRPECATRYDYQLWSDPHLVRIVRYFKSRQATTPGSITDLESALHTSPQGA